MLIEPVKKRIFLMIKWIFLTWNKNDKKFVYIFLKDDRHLINYSDEKKYWIINGNTKTVEEMLSPYKVLIDYNIHTGTITNSSGQTKKQVSITVKKFPII
jgi:hypothetical protein